MKTATRTIHTAAYCLMLTLGSISSAQVPAGQNPNGAGDGRLLDRNLQVGTGGINAPQQQIDYAARNNLITGNVTGLGYFHGRVGYTAPGEFRGSSSDDSLFRFRAQSWSPGLPSINAGQPYAGGVVPIYRYTAGTTSGQVLNNSGPGLIQPFTGSYQSNIAYSNALLAAQNAAGTPRLGVIRQPDGKLLEVSATPFLGVRKIPLTSPNTLANPLAESNVGTSSAGSADGDKSASSNQITAMPAYSTSTSLTDRGSGGTSAENNRTTQRNWKPSLLIGEQIQNMIQPGRMTADGSLTTEKRIQDVQAAIFEPIKSSQVKPGEDPYLDLLARLRSGTPKAGKPAVKPSAEDEEALADPLPNDAAKAKADREAAVKQAYGLLPSDAAKMNGGQQTDAPDPNRAKVDIAMAKFLDSLKTDEKLTRFSGTREDRISKTMRAGEIALGSGKYLDAENYFREVIDLNMNQPLAVSGLIHAQAGAGLIRTAAFNLRRHLEMHPELIGVRYDAKLLPSRARLSWVRAQIEPMLKYPQQGDVAILLAYLGFQLDQPTLVEYGLDKAQAAAPLDPLILVLRRVWTSTDTGATTQPTPKP